MASSSLDVQARVAELNDPLGSSKAKLSALADLARLALEDPDGVLDAFHQIDEHFELALDNRSEANRKYGMQLGRMHETVLLVLIRCTRYTLTTAQLLDFLRGSLPLAMAVLQQLIVCSYEDDAVACALKLLCGFARPSTYLMHIEEVIVRQRGEFYEGSVEAFSASLEAFSAELLRSKLLLTVVPALAKRLAPPPSNGRAAGAGGVGEPPGGAHSPPPPTLTPAQEACARSFMRLVSDLSLLHFDSADASRGALAAASSAGSVLLLPLLERLAPSPSHAVAAAVALEQPAPMLPLTLRTAILLTFRAPPQVAGAFRASGALSTLAPICLLSGRRRLAFLYLALLVNVDALSPASDGERHAAEALLATLDETLASLATDELDACLRSVEGYMHHGGGGGGGELARLPVAREAHTAADLREMLQAQLAAAQPAASSELRAQLSDLADKAQHLESVQAEMDEMEAQLEAEDASLDEARRQVAAQVEALAAELRADEAVAQALAEQLGVDLDGEAEAELPPPPQQQQQQHGQREEAPQGPPPPRSSERYRLLGELPSLNLKQGPRGRILGSTHAEGGHDGPPPPPPATRKVLRVPRAAQRTRAAAAAAPQDDEGGDGPLLEENVPPEFLCAINQHLMRTPVRSPHGHVFEEGSILSWLEKAGSICPLSGRPLTATELEVDHALRKSILEWNIKQQLQAQAKLDAEADLYAFD